MVDSPTLGATELEMLSDLNCLSYGYVRLGEEKNARKRKVVVRAVHFLEQVLVARSQKKECASVLDPSIGNDEVLVRLGHFHLLLENYAKALSAYSKYASLNATAPTNTHYLYGMGMVHFHFRDWELAGRAFRQVLYIEPSFRRAKDIHVRLGLITKMCDNYRASQKHFQIARHNSSECVFGPQEVDFHLAHLHEISGQYKKAVQMYTEMTRDKDLSSVLRAEVHRQLGWVYFNVDSLGEEASRLQQAIQHLQKAVELDPKSVQSKYLLGRCLSTVQKVHEAFLAYRHSVDKSECKADTWCSIGVLYHNQGQQIDALQAYMCAVQHDKYHSAAWTNLGILYESVEQLRDALACYTNAVSRAKDVSPHLHQRIKYMKTQLNNAPSASNSQRPKVLASVEEAWNQQISQEISRPPQNQKGVSALSRKRSACDDMEGGGKQQVLTQEKLQEKLQTLQYLQSQNASLYPQQQQFLHQLQQQFAQLKHSQAQSDQDGDHQTPVSNHVNHDSVNVASASNDNQAKDIGSYSDRELEALISQQDIGSFAESLLKEIQADSETTPEPSVEAAPVPAAAASTAAAVAPDLGAIPSASSNKESTVIKQCEVRLNTLDIPTKLDTVQCEPDQRFRVDHTVTAEIIVQKCKALSQSSGPTVFVQPRDPFPLDLEAPTPALTRDMLLPATPSIHLENKKLAFSGQLQEFCGKNSVTVVRTLASALKLDLGLFSTKTIAEMQPDREMEVLIQVRHGSDDNTDLSTGKQTWHLQATPFQTTVAKYSQYQTATFAEGLKDEKDKPSSKLDSLDPEEAQRRLRAQQLQFGHSLDMSNPKLWRPQLSELMKLPPWARVVAPGNMLSHLGQLMTGVNAVELQMKVPCSRTSARREGNGFCSVNLNIGPGDCEWFIVPQDYWAAVKKLCDKHKVDFSCGSWWPNMKDLMDNSIPVYRFHQRPGDMVWVNMGCIYWSQAVGWCNNIKWNVGPHTAKQFTCAIEIYEWSRFHFVKSPIPMLHLAWNLAKNVRFSEERLFKAIKDTLSVSLRDVAFTVELVRKRKMDLKFHGRRRPEPAQFCDTCDSEVFGVLFVRQNESGHVVNCLVCALATSNLKGYICLEEFSLNELVSVYNNFVQHAQPSTSMAAAAAAQMPAINTVISGSSTHVLASYMNYHKD